MKHPLAATLGLAAIAGLALLVLAHTHQVSAQQELKLTIDDPGVIKPETGSKTINVKAKVTLPNNLLSPVGVYASNIVVTVQATCPAGITVTGPGSILVPVDPTKVGTQSTFEGQESFKVTVTRDVPGLKLQTCSFKGTTPAYVQDAVAAGASITQNFQLTADYYSLMTAKVGTKIQTAAPQKSIPFDIILENKGNARTHVVFSLTTGGEAGSKWNPILPEVLDVDSFGDPNQKTTETAIFNVNTPFRNGWNNAEKTFQLGIATSATADPAKPGNTLTASMLARVRGIYVPAVEPMLMVAAVLGTALVVRLNKAD